jgi:hypothetical protein
MLGSHESLAGSLGGLGAIARIRFRRMLYDPKEAVSDYAVPFRLYMRDA